MFAARREKQEELEDEIDAEMEKNEALLEKLEERTEKGDTSFIRSQKHYKKTKMVLEKLKKKGRNGTIGV